MHHIAIPIALAVMTQHAAADLIHHYPFDVDATDVVGGADGELLNGAEVAGGVLVLDGTDDYVQLPQKIVPTSGSFSVAMWFHQDVAQSEFRELIGQGFAGCCGFYIGHNPSGNFRVGDSWMNTGVPFPDPGAWNHVAVTVDTRTSRSRLYVGGLPMAEVPYVLAMTSDGQDTVFGRQYDPFEEHFDGMLDDIRIYDHALAALEVAELAGLCPWDLDNSGDVGVKDLLILLGAWGPCPPKEDCPADFDLSGDVGVKDLLFLLGNWGPCP